MISRHPTTRFETSSPGARSPRSHAARHRSLLEPLEGRMLMSAGDLDVSFSGDGTLTTDFGAGSNDRAYDVAVQADGKSVVVGVSMDFAVARYNVDGTPDTSFGPTGSGKVLTPGIGTATAVAIQPDGKIVVAGTAGGRPKVAVVRYLSDGQLDTSFSGDGKLKDFDTISDFPFPTFDGPIIPDTRADVAIQRDGRIVVVASAPTGSWDRDNDFAVARYNPNGSRDTTFGSPVYNPLSPPQRSGKTYVGFGVHEFAAAVAIDYSGTAASNPRFGSIVIAGQTHDAADYETGARFAVARLKTNGTVDGSFDGDGRVVTSFPGRGLAVARGVAIQPDGRIVAVGAVGDAGNDGPREVALARYLSNGTLDPSFGASGDGRVVTDLPGSSGAEDVVIGYEGNLLVGGASGGNFAVARYTPAGVLDNTFSGDGVVTTDFGADESVGGLALAPGGKVVAAGTPDRPGTGVQPDFAVARYFDFVPTVAIHAFDSFAVEGPNPASFIVTRSEYLPIPTRVYFSAGGTATAPSLGRLPADYSGVSSLPDRRYVDIAAGENFSVVTINPTVDDFAEGTETAVFTIAPGNGEYEISAANSVATLTISDALAPVADAYVQDGASADTNFGSEPSLVVKKGPAGFNRESFLTFNLAGVGTVNRAVLRLYGRINGGTNTNVLFGVYGVATPWAESGITFNNRPATTAAAVASGIVTDATARWYEFDVTAYVQSVRSTGRAGFALKNVMETINAILFNSGENAFNQPQLIIT